MYWSIQLTIVFIYIRDEMTSNNFTFKKYLQYSMSIICYRAEKSACQNVFKKDVIKLFLFTIKIHKDSF